MSTFVALFRGINVGRAKRIAMADLRALLHTLGYGNARTLLNSGNALFDTTGGTPIAHAARIRTAVAERLGVDALVIVKSLKEIDAIMAGNALAARATDSSRLLVAVTTDARSLAALRPLHDPDGADDPVHVGKHAAYLWCAKGILESKPGIALLRDLATSGTTRNWATMTKIQALMSAS